MSRAITIVGAPSSIGIKPYDDGTMRRLDLAPAAFLLILGGDCSIVLGCLSGVRRKRARVGLVYVDAHADFATPELSRTGSAASMCLALAVGRGDSTLARLDGEQPLVRPDDLVVIGRRDDADAPWYGQDVLRAGPMLDLNQATIRERGIADISALALGHVTRPGVDGFWIHVDADVIDPSEVPAVDSPEPGGLLVDELAELLAPLIRHPDAIGLELTIYDPQLDPDRTSAVRLANLLERAMSG